MSTEEQAAPPRRKRRSARKRQSECPVCNHFLGKGKDPAFSEWAKDWYDLAQTLRDQLREEQTRQLGKEPDASSAGSKVRELRDQAVLRLAELLPEAEKQAATGKTALLRLILRALR